MSTTSLRRHHQSTAQTGATRAETIPSPPAMPFRNSLVIHAQERAEAVLFHHRASPLGPVFSQPVPVDPLLPIHSGDAEIRAHVILPKWLTTSPLSEKFRARKRFGAAPRTANALHLFVHCAKGRGIRPAARIRLILGQIGARPLHAG